MLYAMEWYAKACYDEWQSNVMLWDSYDMVWDVNVMIWNCNPLLWYDACCKEYAWTDCTIPPPPVVVGLESKDSSSAFQVFIIGHMLLLFVKVIFCNIRVSVTLLLFLYTLTEERHAKPYKCLSAYLLSICIK